MIYRFLNTMIMHLLPKVVMGALSYFLGAYRTKEKSAKKEIKDVKKAKDYRDKLSRDSSYRQRVRDRFR